MTEPDWLQCTKLEPMLDFLAVNHFDKAHGRKIHLFACGCVRRVGPLLTDVRSQEAVLTAERFAEGQATEDDIEEASERAWEAAETAVSAAVDAAARAAASLASTRSWDAAWDGSQNAAVAEMRNLGNEDYPCVRSVQCDLLRDVFGSLFRPATVDPAWLTWNNGTIGKLAQTIYDERRFESLPVLADALEEAGCTNDVIMSHCRSGQKHVRGCWVVDLVLGKA